MAAEIVGAAQILDHVTPEVMANHLPAELVTEILSRSLAEGSMSPESVMTTLTPEKLANHIPTHILWKCVADAAKAAGLTEPGA